MQGCRIDGKCLMQHYAKSDASNLMYFNLILSYFIHTHTSHARAHTQCHQTRVHTSRNGFSDPFCKVLVDGKETGRTTILEKTLNPGVCCGGVFKEVTPRSEAS
jgi:hypothetical protein